MEKRNLRKPESEIISLYATLQEPEFRCFTLNSQVCLQNPRWNFEMTGTSQVCVEGRRASMDEADRCFAIIIYIDVLLIFRVGQNRIYIHRI
jgi:hypothetical protein